MGCLHRRTKHTCIFTRRTSCCARTCKTCHFFAKPFQAFFSCQRSAGFFDQARFAQKHITQPGDSMVWPQRERYCRSFSPTHFSPASPRRLAKQPNKKHFASPTASEHKHSTLLGSRRCAAAPGNSGLDDVKVLPELDFYGMTFAARLSMMHLCYREASCLQGFQFRMWRAQNLHMFLLHLGEKEGAAYTCPLHACHLAEDFQHLMSPNTLRNIAGIWKHEFHEISR